MLPSFLWRGNLPRLHSPRRDSLCRVEWLFVHFDLRGNTAGTSLNLSLPPSGSSPRQHALSKARLQFDPPTALFVPRHSTPPHPPHQKSVCRVGFLCVNINSSGSVPEASVHKFIPPCLTPSNSPSAFRSHRRHWDQCPNSMISPPLPGTPPQFPVEIIPPGHV